MSACTYRIHNGASGALKGYLTATGTTAALPSIVIEDPVLVRKINDGMGTIKLRLNVQVGLWDVGKVPLDGSGGQMLAFFDVIEVRDPTDTLVLGKFVFEGLERDGQVTDAETIECAHVVVDLQDTDCDPANSNYTTVAQPGAPAQGVKDFGYTITAQIPRCKHCTAGTVGNDGNTYALDYTRSQIRAALDQGVNLGGPNWWWWCNPSGSITVAGSPSSTSALTASQISWCKFQGTVANAYNVQHLSGRVDNTTGLPIQLTVSTTTGFWSTGSIGRRVAPPYADPMASDTATLTRLGNNILSRSQTEVLSVTARLVNTTRINPGQQVTIPSPWGDGTTLYWVTQVSETIGTTTSSTVAAMQDVVLQSQFGAYHAAATPQAPAWMDNLMAGAPWGGGGGGGVSGLLVAGGNGGPTGQVIMTSPDGTTWTAISSPFDNGQINAITVG